jgi:hypothetical protein
MKKIFIILMLSCAFASALDNLLSNYMLTDNAHKNLETEILSSNYSVYKAKALSQNAQIAVLINPKLRLSKTDIDALKSGASLRVDGAHTKADIKFVSQATQVTLDATDLLVEDGYWDTAQQKFHVTYRLPGDAEKGKTLTVSLSNVHVKNKKTELGKHISQLISTLKKSAVVVVQPTTQVIQPPSTVVVQQPTQIIQAPPQTVVIPAAQPQTVIVEEVRRPVPVIVESPVIIGGYGHHHHHR